jgi:hypothetical protein
MRHERGIILDDHMDVEAFLRGVLLSARLLLYTYTASFCLEVAVTRLLKRFRSVSLADYDAAPLTGQGTMPHRASTGRGVTITLFIRPVCQSASNNSAALH